MSVLGKAELKARYAKLLGQETIDALSDLARRIVADIQQRYVDTGETGGRLYYEHDGVALPITDEAVEHMTAVLDILIFEETREFVNDLSIDRGHHNSLYVNYEAGAPYIG